MYPSANSDQTNQLRFPAVILSKRTKTLQKSIKVLKSVLFVPVHPTLYDLNWYKTLMDWKHRIILFIPFISQSEFINSLHTRKILYFSHLFFFYHYWFLSGVLGMMHWKHWKTKSFHLLVRTSDKPSLQVWNEDDWLGNDLIITSPCGILF